MTWRETIQRAWRVWRTNRRTFPPDCEYCGEPMVRHIAATFGYQPRGPEWECAKQQCRYADLPRVMGFGGSNAIEAPPCRLDFLPR